MFTSLCSLGLFALGVYGQTSSSFGDSNTGITFQRYSDPTTGFSWGMSVPETIGSDFIGQMVMETNGSGYAGVSLTGEMVGSLLIVAWPNDDSVVASFRETSGYTSPSVYSNSSLSMSVISNGTFVNSTHMSYTFLCSGCITGDSYSFAATSTDAVIGWAVSSNAVTNPSSAESASFQYHNTGYGEFSLALTDAKSTEYSSWASMATISNSSSTGTSTNSTCTSTSANTTATVSSSQYDYIVAGAGPAGIIVAERLAESGASVLLLERGTDSYYFTGGRSTVNWNSSVTQYDVPSMSYYLTSASDTSEYCTDTASMAGCILGGGTVVNALMFVRPQEADFNDKWPTGWKWNDVSAAAQRLYERNPGTTLASKDGKRYDQGAYGILSTFFNGLGWNHVDALESPNEKTQVYSYPPWDIVDGLRAGPLRTYYPLAQNMSNFKLTLNTKVIGSVRNGTTISGVEVEDSTGARQIINVNAGGSVILAAGSMSTPRILFNSGIGPSDQINIVKNGCTDVTLPAEADWIDLPVGKNLRDHPIFTLLFNTTMSNVTSMLASAFTSPNTTDIDLFAQGSGPLVQSGQRLNFWTSLNTTNGTRYFQGTCGSPTEGQVRIKLYLTHGLTSTGVLGITDEGATEFTANPWMNTDADKSAVTTMIDYLLTAAKNSSVISPSDSTATGASLISSYVTGDHFVGTAQMSASNDGTGVVDTDTKVYGTDNLYVVDASIHPDLPTGNTQAMIMLVAEQAAARILSRSNSSTSVNSASSGNYTLPASIAAAKATALSSFAPTSFVTSARAVTDSSPTTLTVLATSVETIYSCAASVTNCPARSSAVGSASVAVVTTYTVTVATTVVPISEISSATAAAISQAKATGASGIAAINLPSTTAASMSGVVAASSVNALAASASQTSGSTTLTVLAASTRTTVSSEQTIIVTDTVTLLTTVCPVTEAASASSAAISLAKATGATGIAAIPIPSTTAASSVDAISTSASPISGSTTLTVLAASTRTTVSAEKTIVVTDTVTLLTTVCPVTEAESASSAAISQASATGLTNIAALATPSTTPVSLAAAAAATSASSPAVSSAAAITSAPATATGSTTLTVYATSLRTITSCAATITNCPAASATSESVVTDTIVILTTVCPVTEAESATSAAIAQASATGALNIGAIQVAATTTSSSAVAAATDASTGVTGGITALSGNSSSLLGNSSTLLGGNSTLNDGKALPTGTTLEDILSWIVQYVRGITG